MKKRQAFRFKLAPNPSQVRKLRKAAGCCRFVFNKALELQRKRFDNGEKKLGYAALCRELTSWRHREDMNFLKKAPSQPLQQALKDLEQAYSNFFAGRAGLPRFKKRSRRDGFRYPAPDQVKLDEENGRIFLPKLGWMRYRQSRQIEGTVRQVTVTSVAGDWYISVQTDQEMPLSTHPSNSMVGIDLGVAQLAVLSDGTAFAPLNGYRQHGQQVGRAQRSLSRKKRLSANWRKQKRRIQKLYRKVAEARRDYLHKITNSISKNHAVVVIEDLQVSGMSRSSAGSIEQPGKKVRAKSGLNKSILDQGWYEFRRQLQYKQTWSGGTLIVVPAHYTSQRCSSCGCVDAANRRAQSVFQCIACEHNENADLNAAKNILAAGRAAIACGEDVRPGVILAASMKQEPTVSAA